MAAGDWDTGRRWATVFGAVFQVAAGALVPVGEIAGGTPSLVLPAGYAFAIWGVIFALGLAYAGYQMLPSRRVDPLLRRIGWPLAGAFILNGVWEVCVLLRQPVLLQAIIAGIFACAAVAFVRLVRSEGSALKGVGRWLVAPTIGLLFGWITAANVVSFNDTLVQTGVMGSGIGAALVGGLLLVLGGLVTAGFVRVGRGGIEQGYLCYGAAVLWGLAAVVVNQYDASLLTSGAAVLAAVVVAASLTGAPGGGGSRSGADAVRTPSEADGFAWRARSRGGQKLAEKETRFGSDQANRPVG